MGLFTTVDFGRHYQSLLISNPLKKPSVNISKISHLCCGECRGLGAKLTRGNSINTEVRLTVAHPKVCDWVAAQREIWREGKELGRVSNSIREGETATRDHVHVQHEQCNNA